MSNSHHQDCCSECQYTLFWQPGACCDTRSDLVKQFASENSAVLQGLKNAWQETEPDSREEKAAAQAMKDLYHDFLARQKELVSEGFLLQEMASVTESLELVKKARANHSQPVGVSV